MTTKAYNKLHRAVYGVAFMAAQLAFVALIVRFIGLFFYDEVRHPLYVLFGWIEKPGIAELLRPFADPPSLAKGDVWIIFRGPIYYLGGLLIYLDGIVLGLYLMNWANEYLEKS